MMAINKLIRSIFMKTFQLATWPLAQRRTKKKTATQKTPKNNEKNPRQTCDSGCFMLFLGGWGEGNETAKTSKSNQIPLEKPTSSKKKNWSSQSQKKNFCSAKKKLSQLDTLFLVQSWWKKPSYNEAPNPNGRGPVVLHLRQVAKGRQSWHPSLVWIYVTPPLSIYVHMVSKFQ